LVSSRPTKVWNANRSAGVGSCPINATQATSVKDRLPSRSAREIPQKLSAVCRWPSTEAPIIVPNRRSHHGRLSAVCLEIRLRISGPQASVAAMAASTASDVG
jgi:hypothetical protein